MKFGCEIGIQEYWLWSDIKGDKRQW